MPRHRSNEGGYMKIVKITIEVEVPDDASHVAVDMNGLASYRRGDDWNEKMPESMNVKWNTLHHAKVSNWRETLTEVK
jgi:hypothetical protein